MSPQWPICLQALRSRLVNEGRDASAAVGHRRVVHGDLGVARAARMLTVRG